jgi:hypothetical protein
MHTEEKLSAYKPHETFPTPKISTSGLPTQEIGAFVSKDVQILGLIIWITSNHLISDAIFVLPP